MYAADLAHVHDAGFGDFAERAAPELLRILRAHGIRPAHPGRATRIVEVGCGSGILARRLVDAGFEVIGLDRSPDMIRLARARTPEASFRVVSLTRAKIPRADAAIAIGEVVSYVAASLRPFFERVYAALPPGGVFIFDFLESAERRTFGARTYGGSDWALVAPTPPGASSRGG
jgi:SAM-dependent methyltransferase